jgi:transglutaminase-like putative cysteine protease
LPQALPLSSYLTPSTTIDSAHPEIRRFAMEATAGAHTPAEKARQLYYAVRDGIRYDPYAIDLSVAGLLASATLARGRGWCVPKAVLLAAGCRAAGVPARLGFADVRNHLSTARMRALMKTDVFFWHGYTAIHLDGRWVKATPAFNIELCQRFALKPLEFDGRADAIYHPFDLQGHRHMEYLAHRGEFRDVPIDQIRATFQNAYTFDAGPADLDFERDAARETSP